MQERSDLIQRSILNIPFDREQLWDIIIKIPNNRALNEQFSIHIETVYGFNFINPKENTFNFTAPKSDEESKNEEQPRQKL